MEAHLLGWAECWPIKPRHWKLSTLQMALVVPSAGNDSPTLHILACRKSWRLNVRQGFRVLFIRSSMAGESGTHGQPHKAHRSRQAGPSAKRKKKGSSKSDNENVTDEQRRQQNPKAFAFNSSVKAKRLQSRTAEREQRRLHVPTIDRTYGEAAPFVVLVHGPPKVSGRSLWWISNQWAEQLAQ